MGQNFPAKAWVSAGVQAGEIPDFEYTDDQIQQMHNDDLRCGLEAKAREEITVLRQIPAHDTVSSRDTADGWPRSGSHMR